MHTLYTMHSVAHFLMQCNPVYYVHYRSLAADTLTGKPTYNHTLSPDECLSEPFTILQLNMKTITVSQLEVITINAF